MSILNVNTIQPIGSGTTVTVAATELKTSNFITVGTGASVTSPSANVLTLGTNTAERFRITSAGSIGIGTDNPDATLKVNVASGNNGVVVQNTSTANIALIGARNGDATVQIGQWGSTASGSTFGLSNADLSFIYTTSYSTTHPSALALGTVSNKPIVFATNNTERLRITSAGNLGIGDVSPTKPLTVGTTTPVILLDDQSSRTLEIRGPSTTHNATVLTTSVHDLLLGTNNTERLRITSGGNIGIGINNPAYELEVASSDTTTFNITAGGNTNLSRLFFSDDDAVARGYLNYDHQADALLIATAGSERLRITDAGMVGINMTPSATGNSTYMLQMYNAGSQCFMSLGQGSGNGPLNGLVMGVSNAAHYITGRENRPMIFGTNDTERMRIGNDGKFYYATTSQGPHGGFFNIDASSSGRNGMNVKGTTANYAYISSAGGSSGDHIHFSNYSNSNQETGRIKDNQSNVTYYTSSDYRLKDNIVSITDGITRVKQLNPVRHTWINNPALGTVDGWIAHELDEVCPDAVDGEKDAVREDGSIKAQAADYGRITPLLAAALKEAIAKIEALEARVTTLEG